MAPWAMVKRMVPSMPPLGKHGRINRQYSTGAKSSGFHWLTRPTWMSHSQCDFLSDLSPLPCSAPATLDSSLLPRHAPQALTSGSLHLLFLLLGCSSPSCANASLPSLPASFRSFLKHCFSYQKLSLTPFPTSFLSMAPVTTQHTLSLIYCLSYKTACVVRAGILSLLCTVISPVSRTDLTHRRYMFAE